MTRLPLCGYFLSPIDLIPDFIPVLGYLDELILLPLSIHLILKLVPEPVLVECRAEAQAWIAGHKPTPRSIAAAVMIVLLWMAFFGMLWKYWGDDAIKWFGAISAACTTGAAPTAEARSRPCAES